jgi:hypothetical protein
MKLVQILARELSEWPVDGSGSCLVQDPDASVYSKYGGDPDPLFYDGEWIHVWYLEAVSSLALQLATDYATAIVTKALWEAEKCNWHLNTYVNRTQEKDGWILHHGGKCPVDAGTVVDVRYRSGTQNNHVKALFSTNTGGSLGLTAFTWAHYETKNDIMAYRLCGPVIEPTVIANIEAFNTQADIKQTYNAKAVERDPRINRDRIQAIDVQMQELTLERTKCVDGLAAEGFALLAVVAAVEPAAEFGDWLNWEVGDMVEAISVEAEGQYTKGKVYEIKSVYRAVIDTVMDDNGDDSNGWHWSNFKFHSRPKP